MGLIRVLFHVKSVLSNSRRIQIAKYSRLPDEKFLALPQTDQAAGSGFGYEISYNLQHCVIF